MREKTYKKIFGRSLIVAVCILLQLLCLVLLIQSGIRRYAFLAPMLGIISAMAALYIINRTDTAGYKLIWTVLILIFPIFGGLFYVMYRLQASNERLLRPSKKTKSAYLLPGDALSEAAREMPRMETSMASLQNFSGYPVYDRTKTTYFPSGEEKFTALLDDLRAAQNYIFLEYFIIKRGKMWQSILDTLYARAARGVEVRLMFDDMGSLNLLSQKEKAEMGARGIKCVVFNPFRPFLSVVQNNRDHRKIAVIDGKVAYTGGVNIADEYINLINRFGTWRDAALRMEGAAAWSMTVMFLEMWGTATKSEEDISRYYPYKKTPLTVPSDGYVQPYADSPLDADHVGERAYMQMITGARRYLYISTPYLILDDHMLAALRTAVQSGVDVRILTPERWDKRLVHLTTRSYYNALLSYGVKIYEYTGGFNHAKTFVSDDVVAAVGTVNLDYRSLYLHFECGVKLYGTESVMAVRQDFLHTISKSREITEKDIKRGAITKIAQSILRLFAPLM